MFTYIEGLYTHLFFKDSSACRTREESNSYIHLRTLCISAFKDFMFILKDPRARRTREESSNSISSSLLNTPSNLPRLTSSPRSLCCSLLSSLSHTLTHSLTFSFSLILSLSLKRTHSHTHTYTLVRLQTS